MRQPNEAEKKKKKKSHKILKIELSYKDTAIQAAETAYSIEKQSFMVFTYTP